MLANVGITQNHYIIFTLVVLVLLVIDLGFIHRNEQKPSFRKSLIVTFVWIALSMAFAFLGLPEPLGTEPENLRISFITGYILEYSLSMDNVFVIALIFSYFKVLPEHQHRVLFWGIVSAMVLRGVMIGLGVAIVTEYEWVLYMFGAFLVYSGIKMLLSQEEGVDPEQNPLVILARRFLPISKSYDGQNFRTVENGVNKWTPLIVVLIAIESADVIFAVDSIPAIFSVTKEPYIVYTSNICAILGLRSLYFVLKSLMHYFRFLKVGMCVILVLIGLKMLYPWGLSLFGRNGHSNTPQPHQNIETFSSLVVIISILLLSMLFSVVLRKKGDEKPPDTL